MRQKLLAALLGLTMASQAFAVSVSLLHGKGFRDDLDYRTDKTIMTIENFSVWEYGTVFFYFDLTEPFSNDTDSKVDNDFNGEPVDNQYFGGIAPTFSLNKMTGVDFTYGWLRDISVRLELENGSGSGVNNFRNYFYGLQYDLAVPGFDFVSLNTVIRDNPEDRGVGFQIGGFWQMSWEFHRWARFKFTGFFAASPWDGDQDPEMDNVFAKRGRYLTTQPQLLYDLGYGMWGKQNRLEVGFEYAYFLNRYQLKDKDEKVLQYMVKVSF